MNEVAFVQKREPNWQRLSILCDKADVSVGQLPADELLEIVKLYRQVSADLALVSTQSTNHELVGFLNALVGRAYGILYRRPRGKVQDALQLLLKLVAQTVRRRKVFLGISLAIFLASSFFNGWLLTKHPDYRPFIVPAAWEPQFEHWKTGKHQEHSVEESFVAVAGYGANNPVVAIRSIAISVSTFGIGTAYVLWMNGQLMGALSADMLSVGKLGHLLVSVAPHGATEMTGFIVAGGAGLCLGWALISPGRRRRGDSLREAGKDGLILMVLAIAMMFLAAPVEAFFSFNPNVPNWAKAAFGVASLTAWLAYWIGYGREEPGNKFF